MRSWILRNRRVLRVLWVLLAFFCVIQVISLRGISEITIERYEFLLFLSPFALGAVVHMALMYASWFETDNATGFIVTVKRSFFWISLVAFVIIFVGMIWLFGVN